MRNQKSSVSRLCGTLSSVAPSLLLAGCSTLTTLTSGNDPDAEPIKAAARSLACGAFKPLTYSRRDTPETMAVVQGHNAAWTTLCASRRPAEHGPAGAPGHGAFPAP
jgi:hypothetical protein